MAMPTPFFSAHDRVDYLRGEIITRWESGTVSERTNAAEGTVNPDRLKQMMKSSPEILLIDVREPEEFTGEHIPGALSIPLGQLDVAAERFDPDRPIVTYCGTGVRGGAGARLLARRGFDARSLEGGIKGWPFEKTSGPAKSLERDEIASTAGLLEVAVIREIQAAQYYSLAAKRVSNPAAKEVLEYLEVMEERHTDIVFSKYKSAAQAEGRAPADMLDLTALAARPVDDWDVEDDSVAEIARSYDVDMDLENPEDAPEVLERAVAWELEAYDFYRRSAELVEDDALRSVLIDMAFEERTHANMILKVMGSMGGGK